MNNGRWRAEGLNKSEDGFHQNAKWVSAGAGGGAGAPLACRVAARAPTRAHVRVPRRTLLANAPSVPPKRYVKWTLSGPLDLISIKVDFGLFVNCVLVLVLVKLFQRTVLDF